MTKKNQLNPNLANIFVRIKEEFKEIEKNKKSFTPPSKKSKSTVYDMPIYGKKINKNVVK
tara:strand:- start:1138 stop:1317 length:180 start_codon:yes stop_codon:yes gene_type:complete